MRSGRAISVAIAILVTLVPGADAQTSPTPPTREEFIADAERICRVHYRDTFRLLDRAGDLAGGGSLNRAGRVMLRAFRIAIAANRELRELPRPPLDEVTLTAWLKANRRSFRLGIDAGRALKGDHPARAKRLQGRASQGARRANEKVADFEFRHCV